MRRRLLLLAAVCWLAAACPFSARADEPGSLPPIACAPAACPTTTAGSVRVVVHVPKPEVVVEDADCCATSDPGRKWCLFHHRKRPLAPPPQTVATILAPTPALVPAPATALMTVPGSCANPGTSTMADDAGMRAAQDLELALANLSAARAAQRARLDAADAAVQRVTAAAVQVTQGLKSPTQSPQGDTRALTLDTLARNLQALNERVDALDRLVRQHQQLLRAKFPDAFKPAGQ